MSDHITQFELLLEAGKFEEAKQTLAELSRRPLSSDEQADAKILLTRLYIKLSNAVNEAYLATLKDAIAQLKDLNVKEKAFMDKVKLAETRAGLAH